MASYAALYVPAYTCGTGGILMAVTAAAIGSALNLPLTSDLQLAGLAKAGLPLGIRDAMLRLGLSSNEISTHVVPARRWSHRSSQRKKGVRDTFSAEESGRILRIVRLVLHASELFGGTEQGLQWLRTPKARFEGQTPLEIAETEQGAMLVEEVLIGAEEGFAA